MNQNKLKNLIHILIGLLSVSAYAQLDYLNLNSTNPDVNWKVYPADEVSNINQLFQAGYDTSDWINATVPGTAFAAYVDEGLEADPNYADNIYQVNPDDYNKNFWYRTEVSIPSNLEGDRVWLNFEGVNRDANIYFNGNYLGKVQGILQRGTYDITSFISTTGSNTLAVLVYLPQGPLNCTASPTYIASASWDWMPYVPGLNSGITNDVFITTSKSVTINDPWVRTEQATEGQAALNISATLQNHSSAQVTGTLTGIISPGNTEFSQTVTIPANGTAQVSSQITISNPQLWWPNGYGEQHLYSCNFQFAQNSSVSDFKEVTFGIRKYSYDTEDGVLHLYVNGKKVFLKGGNWGMSEYMLRCKKDEYDTKIRLHKEMNYNMIRNWVGSTTDEEFYEACDKYGIMVWDDFWLITTYIYWPDFDVFEANVIEKIKRNRNYASIALWCGANEMTPPDDYISMYTNAVTQYDGNDRWFQPNSNAGNMSGSGPWQNFHPSEYYDDPPNMPGAINSYGVRSELGTAVFPNYDSFEKFMPEEYQWPKNEMWQKHFFGDDYAPAANADKYFNTVNNYYGNCNGIKEFCKKAQLVNLQVNKAMYEGWLHNLNDDASGLLIWMSQSAYPSMLWQTYDYYYDLNGAYWGAKSACEPIHILTVPSSGETEVINTSGITQTGLQASLKVYDLHGNLAYNFQQSLPAIQPDSKLEDIFASQNIDVSTLTQVYFERLTLTDASGNIISENFYWKSTNENNYNYINTLQPVTVDVTQQSEINGDETIITATVTNNTNETAFANRIQAINPATGYAVLPAFTDKGYFTLFPGESQVVQIAVKTSVLNGQIPQVKATPYNDDEMGLIQNLALFKPTTTSSVIGTNTGSKATDGSYITRWESEYADPQWVMVDLLNEYNINRIKLTWEGAYASKYDIQLSSDGANWTTLQAVENNTQLVNDFTGLNTNARYVKIYGTERGSVWGYSLYELEVYGQGVLSVQGLALNSLSPYPNPFHDVLYLPLNANTDTFQIKLHDISGRVINNLTGINKNNSSVFEWQPATESGMLLLPGVYFITITQNGITNTCRVIKK